MTATGTPVEGRLISTSRGPVEAAVVGAGPPVILVHGIPGSWRQAVPLALDLAEHYTVILPSRPGYGRTPVKSGRAPADQADLYAAILDALGHEEPAGVVGISGGGPSALAFAQRHPGRTSSLVLVCAVAAHLIDVPTALRIAVAFPPVAHAASVVARSRQRSVLANRDKLDRRISAELTADERLRLERDPAIRSDLEAFLRSHAEAPAGIAGLRNDARQLRLARQTGPAPADRVTSRTLVLHGDEDTVVPLDHAQFHAENIAGARLEILAGAGHVFLLTRRAEATSSIREHLGAG